MLTHRLTVENLWIALRNAPAWLVLARGFLPATGKTPIRPLAKLMPDAGRHAAGRESPALRTGALRFPGAGPLKRKNF